MRITIVRARHDVCCARVGGCMRCQHGRKTEALVRAPRRSTRGRTLQNGGCACVQGSARAALGHARVARSAHYGLECARLLSSESTPSACARLEGAGCGCGPSARSGGKVVRAHAT